jgi:prepilin-type processing-associated H-X9-DG protein
MFDASTTASRCWSAILVKDEYIKNKDMLVCPSHQPETFTSYYWTYGERDWRVADENIYIIGTVYYLKYSRVNSASSYYLYGDSAYDTGYTPSSAAFKQSHVMSSAIVSSTGGLHLRHTDVANLIFIDGHAESPNKGRLSEIGFTSGLDKNGLKVNF